jgi:hypothetical protein
LGKISAWLRLVRALPSMNTGVAAMMNNLDSIDSLPMTNLHFKDFRRARNLGLVVNLRATPSLHLEEGTHWLIKIRKKPDELIAGILPLSALSHFYR